MTDDWYYDLSKEKEAKKPTWSDRKKIGEIIKTRLGQKLGEEANLLF